MQYIRLLLFYSVIFQSVIFHSCKFQSLSKTLVRLLVGEQVRGSEDEGYGLENVDHRQARRFIATYCALRRRPIVIDQRKTGHDTRPSLTPPSRHRSLVLQHDVSG